MITIFYLSVNTYFQKIYSIKFCFSSLNFTIRPLSRPAILLPVARLATCSIYDLYAPPRNGSRFICRLPFFFLRGGTVGSAPLLLAFVKQTGCTPLCSALALRRGTTHVSGSPFAFFRASCRSHTKEVSFVPFGAKSSQNSLPDTSWFRLNSITLKGTCLCG